jgi:hypothetical protein
MPHPARILRSVKDLHTRPRATDQVIAPYQAYMAVTALEMERARRQTERRNLLARLECLDARLQRIDLEKTKLLDGVDKVPGARPAAQRGNVRRSSGSQPAGGFKHQY